MKRREFLTGTIAMSALAGLPETSREDKLTVGVIGHTGRGNYGHGIDTVWLEIPDTNLVAVADADPKGLMQAKERLGAEHTFADYKEMLRTTRPQIVAVCPRQPDQHRDMAVAAAESGAAGIYIEKPFCRTPSEADDIIAACRMHNTKLAIAHRNRWHPVLPVISRMLKDGDLGTVLEIRGRGKGDRRGGGEDLWVLGCHVFNLMHYFGGDPLTCSAILKQDGRRVTRADVKPGNEALGPLAGNEVHARYEMSNGLIAYFDSIANDGTGNAGFGMEIIGSKGKVHFKCDRFPLTHLIPGNPFAPPSEGNQWIPISSAGPGEPEPIADLPHTLGHHVIPAQDLVDAIREDRAPLCDIHQATVTVEMISAVFESHRQNSMAVDIPLKQRDNALTLLPE